MKNILLGIIWGSIITPLSVVTLYVCIWFVFPGQVTSYSFIEWLLGAFVTGTNSIVYAAIFIVAYGLPIFLALRKFNLANNYTYIIVALLPWVIIDGFITNDIRHFIMYGWYSLASGGVFWIFARKTIKTNEAIA